jgi:hypothetical protein
MHVAACEALVVGIQGVYGKGGKVACDHVLRC